MTNTKQRKFIVYVVSESEKSRFLIQAKDDDEAWEIAEDTCPPWFEVDAVIECSKK